MLSALIEFVFLLFLIKQCILDIFVVAVVLDQKNTKSHHYFKSWSIFWILFILVYRFIQVDSVFFSSLKILFISLSIFLWKFEIVEFIETRYLSYTSFIPFLKESLNYFHETKNTLIQFYQEFKDFSEKKNK